jgi:hypothetical protein
MCCGPGWLRTECRVARADSDPNPRAYSCALVGPDHQRVESTTQAGGLGVGITCRGR